MCHCYTSKSLDRVEPSRSTALAIGIVARYDKLAERSWIHASRGGASRLYTRSTPQKLRNQTGIVHRQKLERDKRREIRRGTERCQRGRFMISIKYTKLWSLQCMRGCSEASIASFAMNFHPPIQDHPNNKIRVYQ
jgi:hypothetical protein